MCPRDTTPPRRGRPYVVSDGGPSLNVPGEGTWTVQDPGGNFNTDPSQGPRRGLLVPRAEMSVPSGVSKTPRSVDSSYSPFAARTPHPPSCRTRRTGVGAGPTGTSGRTFWDLRRNRWGPPSLSRSEWKDPVTVDGGSVEVSHPVDTLRPGQVRGTTRECRGKWESLRERGYF